MGALAADREALAVTKAAVAADVHKALDILVALTAEVALNHDLVLIDIIADGVNLILGEVLNAVSTLTLHSTQIFVAVVRPMP